MDFRFILFNLLLYAMAVMGCYYSTRKSHILYILLLLAVCSFAVDWFFFAPL